jgi:hypothetical protein
MKKKLSPIWFLKDPLDPEHKEYILLDYLKAISKDLNHSNCFTITKEISRIIKSLNDYKETKKFSKSVTDLLKREDNEFMEEFTKKDLNDEDLKNIESIIKSSLDTLYGYSGICLEMIKEEESKIKIFKIQSKFDPPIRKDDSGILIIRNMATDKILNYFFRAQIIMKTEDGDKEVFILKKAPVRNPFFSLNYEYIYHEILNEFSINGEHFPHLYVIEIYENFEEESEIYKLAKEKFIDTLSKKST